MSRRSRVWVATSGLVCVLCWSGFVAGADAPSANAPKNSVAPADPPIVVDVPAEAAPLFAGAVPSSVADLKLMQQQVRRLIESLNPAIVGIRQGAAHGSGVIVSVDGYVLTAAHVIQQPNASVEVVLADGRRLKAHALGRYRSMDAGLVKIIEPGRWPFVEIGTSSDVKPGQWCLALGQPGGFERGRKPVLRFGRVLETSGEIIVSDCTLIGGDSGGPLFDASGKVIGIHSRIGGRLTDNLHVPSNAFTASWDRLLAGEVWGHLPGQIPFIGVKGAAGATDARITQVFSETPAQEAGLKVGDVVLRFDGDPVTDFNSLTAMVAQKEPGQEVQIEILRGQQNVTLRLVIGKR